MTSYCKHLSLLAGLLAFAAAAYAQPTPGQGLLLEDQTYNQQTKLPVFGSKFTELPLKMSLRKYCPEVQNQGQIGSCTGWSSGYAAFTIMRAILENNTDQAAITKNAFSALYLYNQAKIADCNRGAYFSQVLTVLKEQGDCPSIDFDEPKDDCDRTPDDALHAKAAESGFEVKDYFTLFKSTDTPQDKILQTKTSIAEQKPVIMGMLIRENFRYLTADNATWDPESGNTANAGGHAMVVVGYDDGREAFLIMNSWGKYWGKDGFGWVRYEDYGKYCVYAYQLLVAKARDRRSAAVTTNPTSPSTGETTNTAANAEQLHLSADFKFRYPVFSDDEDSEEIKFESAPAVFNGAFYTLKRQEWRKGQQFQLVTENITKDRYVYVFSIDAKNTPHIHWPRNEKYNQKFFSLNEGALVPYDSVQIVIPGKDRALILDQPGADHLVVLYSDEKLEDLTEIVQKVTEGNGEIVNRLQTVLGNRMIPVSDIAYQPGKMHFDATTSGAGYIVPIVLQVVCAQ